MIVVPFEPGHIQQLALQSAQAHFYAEFRPGYGEALAASGESFSGFAGDDLVGCAGVVEQWRERALCWALLSDHAGKHFAAIHRAVRAYLDRAPWRRIEAHVDCNFAAAHRWILMLGFQLECPRMRAFTPDGRDSALYARIRGG